MEEEGGIIFNLFFYRRSIKAENSVKVLKYEKMTCSHCEDSEVFLRALRFFSVRSKLLLSFQYKRDGLRQKNLPQINGINADLKIFSLGFSRKIAKAQSLSMEKMFSRHCFDVFINKYLIHLRSSVVNFRCTVEKPFLILPKFILSEKVYQNKRKKRKVFPKI